MDINMSFGEFMIVSKCVDKNQLNEVVNSLPKPVSLCGKELPENLNSMSFKQYCDLRGISDAKGVFFTPARVILDLSEQDIVRERFVNVLGFLNWVVREVKRINALFESTNVPATQEQIRAGYDKLNFGDFGLVDHFARRMGIQDHNKVMSIPWIRIYKCMDMDAQIVRCDRRLSEQQNKK